MPEKAPTHEETAIPEKTPAPQPKPFVFIAKPVEHRQDQRTMEKISLSKSYDSLVLAERALNGVKLALINLEQLHEQDQALLKSGMLYETTQLDADIRQQKLSVTVLRQQQRILAEGFQRRVQEIAGFEELLAKRLRRERREALAKKAAPIKDVVNDDNSDETDPQPTERRLEGQPDNSPTVQIDPTLLGQVTASLSKLTKSDDSTTGR